MMLNGEWAAADIMAKWPDTQLGAFIIPFANKRIMGTGAFVRGYFIPSASKNVANTKDFLFDVVESLCIISECITLEPGDVIITGTPAGVGYARTPPVWMAPGDICEIDIEGVGVLSNPIADEN
jgi:2-keto-4-pentenoate hydratase/2-oxohepta-3-ene-1,7-dioic acid hydratase in catechol pathway